MSIRVSLDKNLAQGKTKTSHKARLIFEIACSTFKVGAGLSEGVDCVVSMKGVGN